MEDPGAGSDPHTLPAEWITPRPLGRSKVGVGRLGLGIREIGPDPGRTQHLLAHAASLGLRYFDTAPAYALGLAERRLGNAMANLGRDDFVISTKVGKDLRRPDDLRKAVHTLGEAVTGGRHGMTIAAKRAANLVTRGARRPATQRELGSDPTAGFKLVPTCDYSYDGVMRSFDASLERLRTDRVDMLLIHDPDLHYRQAVRGAYRALERLRGDGTIGAIGVGMNRTGMLRRFADEGDFDVFLLGGRYSLLDQSAATDLFPTTTARGISVILAGVFNSGILADPSPGATFDYERASGRRLRQALRLKAVCERHGVSLKAAALAFAFGHPAVHTVLLGAVSVQELDESVSLLKTPVPPDLWSELRAEGLLSEE